MQSAWAPSGVYHTARVGPYILRKQAPPPKHVEVPYSVWHSCDLPVRNSPKSSVIEPVSIPPCRILSSSFEPVDSWMISALDVAEEVRGWRAGRREKAAEPFDLLSN